MNDTVKTIVDLYQSNGLNAVQQKHWTVNLSLTSRLNDTVRMRQWCEDNDAHELATWFSQYIISTDKFTQDATTAVGARDFITLDHLVQKRPDIVCSHVFLAGVNHNEPDLLAWACARVASSWDSCFERLLHIAAHKGYLSAVHMVMGKWCEQCQNTTCSHDGRLFLQTPSTSTNFGIALNQLILAVSWGHAHPLNSETHSVIHAMVNHCMWDNSNSSIQAAVKKMLLNATTCNDVAGLQLLLGPNQRKLSAEEQKRNVCVQREHINFALFQHWGQRQWNETLGPLFIGLVDIEPLRGVERFTTFVEKHDELMQHWLHQDLEDATQFCGAQHLKRKM